MRVFSTEQQMKAFNSNQTATILTDKMFIAHSITGNWLVQAVDDEKFSAYNCQTFEGFFASDRVSYLLAVLETI
jgi:hypothetical protein